MLRDLSPRIAEGFEAFEASATLPAADPHPRRLPPGPGPHLARRLSHRGLRGRSASDDRGAPGARLAAARRGVDAALAGPRGPVGGATGGGAERRTGGVAGPGPAGLAAALARAVPRVIPRGVARGRGADRRSTRRCCARSSSTRNAASSSTRPRTSRAGSGRRPRACAACSTRPGRGGRDRSRGGAAHGHRARAGGPDALARGVPGRVVATRCALDPRDSWVGAWRSSGSGSSLFASMDAASRASGGVVWRRGRTTRPPTGPPPSKDLVLVAVSASGRTREVVDVAQRHRGTSLVIGVTNVPRLAAGGGVATSSCRCSRVSRRPGSPR